MGDREIVILSRSERDKCHGIAYMWTLRNSAQVNPFTQLEGHTCGRHSYSRQGAKAGMAGRRVAHTLLHTQHRPARDLALGAGDSTQLCGDPLRTGAEKEEACARGLRANGGYVCERGLRANGGLCGRERRLRVRERGLRAQTGATCANRGYVRKGGYVRTGTVCANGGCVRKRGLRANRGL